MEDTIDKDDAIKVICEDYKNNYKHTPFILQDYAFNGLKINIEIKKHINWGTLMLKFWIVNFEKSCDENEIISLNDTEKEDVFETIEELITFLFEDFRDKYAYSKVLDEIHLKENIHIKEKTLKAYSMLCQNSLPECCCVCMEYNKVLTECNHNVCRVCYASLPYTKIANLLYEYVGKKCPLCRELI
jgi:hypothetical protein